jgi:hypothetical protein
MSAPPLPDTFGNYVLGEFVEVIPPPAISWLPQTAGWRWLGLLLLGIALYYGLRALRRWYRNRYRREAAATFRRLQQGGKRPPGLEEVNQLLKRTALAAWPRQEVASLSGTDWGEFLNRQCPQPPFSQPQIELLGVGTYRMTPLDPDTGRALLSASLTWVREHRNPLDD